MARIRNPRSFAEHFEIEPKQLDALGIFNPVLNVDTKLFIDPVLLRSSGHAAISRGAERSFRSYFDAIIKLLLASKRRGDIAWRTAQSRLRFKEIAATCLGYGASGIRGSAFGPELSARLIDTAKEIVDLGVTDPDLFKLLPLLEEGVGPDLISDLTTNVIVENLAELTAAICGELKVPTRQFQVRDKTIDLPVNPTQARPTAVLLVPTDILRALPVASSWSEVADAAAASASARNRINQMIGNIWSARTRREKAQLRAAVLGSRDAFETLLQLVRSVAVKPYDIQRDPEGLTVWRSVHETIAQDFPLTLALVGLPAAPKAIEIVSAIVDHFQHLVEKQGLWKVLWANGDPHNEKVAQMVFFAMADACKANNLDVTPEADTGSGPVDFKFSSGYNIRVLVEIKLSRNPKLVPGYERQLEAYNESQRPIHAVYLVIDVGRMGRKDQQLLDAKNARVAEGKPASDIVFVDGTRKLSASKR
jgi:hypothetical protein